MSSSPLQSSTPRLDHGPRELESAARAVALSPQEPRLRIRLAAHLCAAGRPGEAMEHLLAGLRIKGDIPDLHNNMGVALRQMGRGREAALAFANAIRLSPAYADAHFNLAATLRAMGGLEESIASYRRVIELRRDFPQAYVGLSEALAGRSCSQEEAIACRRRAVELLPHDAVCHSDLLFTLHYSSRVSANQRLEEAREWARRHGAARPLPAPDVDRMPGRPLRIGYLSPDFRAHTIAHLIEPILESHDRGRFHTYCYSSVQRPDSVTERLKGLADEWRDVSRMSDDEAAATIRRDRIDILVELAGHMAGNRLLVLARRPAPIQVQLGYAGTTGLPSVDYRITDHYSDPPEAEAFYTERLIRLPDCAWPYKPSADSPEVGPLPSLASGRITFGCLNKPAKITDESAAMWGRVLAAVPDSRLIVLSTPGSRGLLDNFNRNGIPPGRVELCPARPRAQYLELFNRIDIALDPFPYTGDTTTCDGLWMGVPLVTLSGVAFVSRRGVCYLEAVGLSELVAESGDEYVAKAVELAGDLQRLAGIRAALRERMHQSPVTDDRRYTAGLEAALGHVWQSTPFPHVR